MKKVCVVMVLACAVACWKTKPNPKYCAADAQCPEPGTGCDQTEHACVPGSMLDMTLPPDLTPMCTSDTQCTSATKPICGADGTCRACNGAADCHAPTPACGASGACVECAMETDCIALGKTTDACIAGSCGACTESAQCDSKVCDAGKCIDAGMVAYVDQGNANCTTTTGNGAEATPFCQVNATALASGKAYLFVAGNATPYDAISISGALNIGIYGPGKTSGVAPKATFSQSGNASLSVSATGSSSALQVVVDGLELTGVGANEPGASCSQSGGSAALTIRNSLIDGSRGAGIQSTGCALTVAESYLTGNNGGGISVTGGTYTIENDLIFTNAATINAPAVAINSTATGTLRFNTIAGNGNAAGIAGISCGNSGVLSDSILTGNVGVGANQSSGCTLTRVVTGGTDGAAGNFALTPNFMSASDFHIVKGTQSNMCCIDQAMDANPPKIDVDFITRPQGNASDIGGNEVVQ
jgi:hypothetical protein